MKNQVTINITRVFTDLNVVKREKLVRLEGDTSLSSLIRDIGYKLIILANGSIKKATSRLRTYHKVAHMVVLITRHHGSAVAVK
jgi:hypothetical protein